MSLVELGSPTTAGRRLLACGEAGRVALVAGDTSLTYGELRERVAARAGELDLAPRSLVVLTGATSLEYVVSYLALLDAGHVPLPAGSHVERHVDRWEPAALVRSDADGTVIDRRVETGPAASTLHDDLALLLTTSGSTGSPKLVRLSARNIVSNAAAIAEYLGLTSDDRAITTLPLHYCYGLSVLHSHLAVGASVVLTEASVVDPCFELALREHRVTNVAGVPHTFELLDRAGAERLSVPSLRFVTQAGGRMAPPRVREWLDRTERWGVDFYVMYGQTEATARMAYLPPELARRRPDAIGVAIPGGSLELRPVDGDSDGTGELVYRGPNVMLGYAIDHDDLALGATLDELHTGDLARFHAADGVFEIVGRRSRFVKPFGVRVDLDEVEQRLAAVWGEVAVAGDDDGVIVSVPAAPTDPVRVAAREVTGLPDGAVLVDGYGSIPRTERGKVDHPALLARARAARVADAGSKTAYESGVRGVFAAVLGRTEIADDATFVSLGGDSLSYVECSVRLEEQIGRLPSDWHLRTVAELSAVHGREHRRAFGTRLDTTVLLRAIGICAVVATHMRLRFIPGGAHLMLAVAGYNLSRFQLPIDRTADRLTAGLRTIGRVAIPTVIWVAIGMALGAGYGGGTLLLVNNYVGPASHRGDHWHFWFVEVFVHLTLVTTLVMAVPAMRRLDRRLPFALPLAAFAVVLLLRMEWAQLDDWYNIRFRTHGVAWFFVLGWLVHRSDTTTKRVVSTLACVLTIPGFFHYAPREWFIATALIVLVWARAVPVPARLVGPVAAIAGASMWIYVTHFTVWPLLDSALPRDLAYVLTLGAGVAVSMTVSTVSRRLRSPVGSAWRLCRVRAETAWWRGSSSGGAAVTSRA